ncbi:MAG: ribonuclease R [Solobacterium sp.]|nr:ribonuclease R [Solobacterium sp.]
MIEMNKEHILNYLEISSRKNRTYAKLKEYLGVDEDNREQFISLMDELLADQEVVLEEGTLYTRSQAGIFTGRLSVNSRGMGFIDREDSSSVRIPPESQNTAMDGDTVLYRCQPWQVYGEVLQILRRARKYLIGTYLTSGRGLKLILDDRLLEEREKKVITAQDFVPYEGLKVQCAIENYSSLTLRVTKELGHMDDPGVDILSVLLDHDIEPEFPEEVLAEARQVPSSVSEADMAGRTDMREELFITIDGKDSKDFDDAVSVQETDEGWLLKVSIADVSYYVREGSKLDQEAFRRGCSVYVTDRSVPMLPRVLSNNICSLNPHEDRLVITCEMVIHPDGETASYKFYPGVINSKYRMTYENVNRILKEDEELCRQYSALTGFLQQLRDCADAIRRYRLQKGAIEFDSEERKITVDENGVPVKIEAKTRGHAEEIIEDCMIAANVSAAEYMRWTEVPSVYRVHGEPRAARMREFVRTSELLGHKFVSGRTVYPNEIQRYLSSVKDEETYPVLSTLLLRSMQKAVYDINCSGHFGLAEESYLHFTSPIRRYPDLIVHRMMRKYIFEGCSDAKRIREDEKRCAEAAEQSSVRERIAQEAEYACDDLKTAQYMSGFIGSRFEGIISGVVQSGMYVRLANTVEGFIPASSIHDDFFFFDQARLSLRGEYSGQIFTLGMKLIVEMAAVEEKGRIVFKLIRVLKKSTAKSRKRAERAKLIRQKERRSRHGRKK